MGEREGEGEHYLSRERSDDDANDERESEFASSD